MEYVIIGNGAAAIACVEGIRKTDPEGGITLVSEENRHCYCRPLISYKLLGKVTEEGMDYRPRGFYEQNRVRALLGVRAESFDPEKKSVKLSDGQILPYDKLLLATGSSPFVPPIAGLEKVEKKHTFLSFSDMQGLEEHLKEDSRVLIVGAGLIGLKCAEGILRRVGNVTVVDTADRILPSVLDKNGAAIIQRKLEAEGVKFYLNDAAAKFEKNSAYLGSGQRIDFDILVMAVGVRPNTGLAKSAGAAVGRGISVDEHCRTSLPDVYAAGDCSECCDISSGERRVLAIMPNANLQGGCAGENMAGGNKTFSNAIPMNAVGFFGSHVLTAGSYTGTAVVEELTAETYRKIWVSNNKLSGFILVNDFERAGIYTSLIRGGVPLDEVDFELLKEKPELLAFSKRVRAEKLARRV